MACRSAVYWGGSVDVVDESRECGGEVWGYLGGDLLGGGWELILSGARVVESERERERVPILIGPCEVSWAVARRAEPKVEG